MSAHPSKRARKRAIQSVARKRSDPSPSATPGRQLHERLSQLEAKVDRLGDAFDQNTEVFSESLKMTEAMHCVLQRALNDQAAHGEYTYANCGMPDWQEYMRYFWLCQLMADFAHWLSGLQVQSNMEPGTLITAPTAGDDRVVETHVFGG